MAETVERLKVALADRDRLEHELEAGGMAVRSRSLVAALILALSVLTPHRVAAQAGFIPGGREILSLTFAGTPVGEFPEGIRLLKGNLAVVLKDGVPMLRASSESEFLVQLAEPLPQDFTLEFDLIPKASGNPSDLMFEGMPSRNRGPVSMEVEWHREIQLAVGGGEMFQMTMPEAMKESLPLRLARIEASFQGETFKLYTNGRRLYTLTGRRFVRGRVLRVFLGGQDDGDDAVYLARLRIATGPPAAAPLVTSIQQTGVISPVPQPSPGETRQPPTGAGPGARPDTMAVVPANSDPAAAPILVGTGISDITGPIAEVGMLGYGSFDQATAGLHTRLFARAFIFASPASGKRVVFVSTELGMLYSSVKQGVLKRLAKLYGTQYDDRNVMLSATHTHAGPGGFSHHVLYNLTTGGHVAQNYVAIVDGITEAIVQAHNRLGLGTVSVLSGEATSQTMVNRSMPAFRLNAEVRAVGATLVPAPPIPGSGQPAAASTPDSVNREMTVLRIESGGHPVGVIAWHAVHNTSMTKFNYLVSSDHKGYAAQLFEKQYGTVAPFQNYGAFVAAFPNGAEGDMSPNILPGFKGPGSTEFGSSAMIGQREFEAAYSLFSANRAPVPGEVDFRHKFLLMPGLVVSSTPHTNGQGGKFLCRGAYGFSFMAGAEDGPSGTTLVTEGMAATSVAELAVYDAIRATVVGTVAAVFPPLLPLVADVMANSADYCQLPKPVLIPSGHLTWTPEVLPFQLLRVGQVVIAGIPGEMTIQAGRRLRDSLMAALAPLGIQRVVLTGLANEYSGYITTPEEYDSQQYEGASTLFGRLTFEAYQEAFRDLATAMVTGQAVVGTNSPPPPDLGLLPQIELQAGVEADEVPAGQEFGQVLVQPPRTVSRGSRVRATWRAGHPKNALRRNDSCFRIERDLGGDRWELVAWDAMPETLLYWGRPTSNPAPVPPTCPDPKKCYWSQMDVLWDVPSGAVPGRYRIRFEGSWKNGLTKALTTYRGTTDTFIVQ